MEATSACPDKDSYDLNCWLMLALFSVYGVIEKTQHNTFPVLKENVILNNAFEDVNRKDSKLHPTTLSHWQKSLPSVTIS